MILPKLSPKSSGNNILRFTDNLGICCGDGKSCYLVCTYKVALDVSDSASFSSVMIDGKEYPFEVVVNPATSGGQKVLIEQLEKALNQAGYDGKGAFYTEVKDGIFYIESDYSAAKLGLLGDAAFEKTVCKLFGDCENSDCCDVALVFSIVEPSKYCFVITDVEDSSGDVIKVVDADGNDVLCWVSDGLAIDSFLEGGAAYVAMTEAGLSFSVDTDLDKVFVNDVHSQLVSLYNMTQDTEVAQIAANEPKYLKICPTTCKPINTMTVNDGRQDVYVGDLSGSGCQVFSASAFSKDGCLFLNLDQLAYPTDTETQLAITVETEGCPSYTETYTLYPQDEVVVEGCDQWEQCNDAYTANLQEFCDLQKALDAGLTVGDEFIIGSPSDLGLAGTRVIITQAMIDAQAMILAAKAKKAAAKARVVKKVAATKAAKTTDTKEVK